MKSYRNTIREYAPKEYYAFESVNSFLYYDGDSTVGGIFSETSEHVLSPNYFYLFHKPKDINFFARSITGNEFSNQSLQLGNRDENIYSLYYTRFKNTLTQTPKSTITFQVSCDSMSIPEVITVEEYNSIQVYDGNVKIADAVVNGNTFSFTDNRPFLKDTVRDYRFYLNNDQPKVVYDAIYLQAYDRSEKETVRTTYTDLVIDKSPEYLQSTGKIIELVNAYYIENDVKIAIDHASGIVEADKTIILEGYYRMPLDITGIKKVGVNNVSDVILSLGPLVVMVNHMRSNNGNISKTINIKHNTNSMALFDLVPGTNYNVVITCEIFSRIETSTTSFTYNVYVNGQLIASPVYVLQYDPYNINDYTTLILGQPYNVVRFNNMYSILTAIREPIYIDNIAIFDRLLTANEILTLHYRSITYENVMKYNGIYHDFRFDKLSNIYSSPTGFLLQNSMKEQNVVSNGTFKKGVRFTGRGALVKTNYLINNTNSRLVNLDSDFTLVFWIQTPDKNFNLFNIRDKASPYNGLTISIINGYVCYEIGPNKYSTNCYISNNNVTMLCIRKTGRTINTYVPLKHDTSFVSQSTITTSGTPNYTSILGDMNAQSNKDVTLYALQVFPRLLNKFDVDALFRENVMFKANGYVNFRNLPILTEVRIIDHYSGKLIDKVYTDNTGSFEYSNNTKIDIDIIIPSTTGNMQVIGPITLDAR